MTQMLPAPPRMKIIRSAGALVWRLRDTNQGHELYGYPLQPGDIEVLLVHRPRYNDWSWPKGKRESGESLAACAVREVEEETGVAVRLGVPLTTQRYRLGSGSTKNVHYWVGMPLENGPALRGRVPVVSAPHTEIDKVEWVTPENAMQLLTRRGDRRLLDELLGKLVERTLDTRALLVFRNGQVREASSAGAILKALSLDRVGVSQALNFNALMSAYGVSAVHATPWRSSLASVMTYASLTGAAMSIEKFLEPDAYEADPMSARAWMKELPKQLWEGPHRSLALCLHRKQLPAIIGEMSLHSSNAISRKYPQEDPRLAHGGALVLHVAPTVGENRQVRVVDVEIL